MARAFESTRLCFEGTHEPHTPMTSLFADTPVAHNRRMKRNDGLCPGCRLGPRARGQTYCNACRAVHRAGSQPVARRTDAEIRAEASVMLREQLAAQRKIWSPDRR